MPQSLLLPQQDQATEARANLLRQRQSEYRLVPSRGLPIGEKFYPRDAAGTGWALKLLVSCYQNRANLEAYLKVAGRKFTNELPKKSPAELAKLILSKDFGEILTYYIPRMGLVQDGTSRPQSIDDYKKIFQREPLPRIADHFMEDWVFARGFVAGPNPMILRRLDAPMAKLRVTNAIFKLGPDFVGDSLNAAIGDGRVFVADYQFASGFANGMHPQQPKYLSNPIVMLAVPRFGRSLVPIAIQCGQDTTAPIFTPFDNWSWQMAKHAVHAVDGTYQEVVCHLGYTHLIMEPFVVATRRHLAETHPIFALLSPHFEGTLPINALAFGRLINEGQDVDTLVGCTMASAYKLLGEARLNFSFSGRYVPKELASRGLDDKSRLPDHPYRDDALRVWNATHDWVRSFVNRYYASESDVQLDAELQSWAQEIADPSCGAIKDLGTNGKISDRETLVDVVTMVIFTGSAQHAAVNFAQKSDMAFHPAYPLSGYHQIPADGNATEKDFLEMLAPIDVALRSVQSLTFLGSLRYGKLGHYGSSYFQDAQVIKLMATYQSALSAVEAAINDRNKQMVLPYVHLQPSRIPQSTNI